MRIPAGVDDGQRIRLKGRGGPGRNGGPAGDLYVVVRVRRTRSSVGPARNLTLTVPITFAEAALGADITVPTLARRAGHAAGARRAPGRAAPSA